MIIDRHNYQEFFLLYVDNELTPKARAGVDSFILQNPDLADELEMLKQATLPEETIQFDQKEILFNQTEGISLQNYEAYFLLSLDRELSPIENEEVEKFVLKHPELQNEFVLWQQVKLEPEKIVFEAKGKLYKPGGIERMIGVSWGRFVAAAAIIGLVAFTWIFNQNSGNRLSERSVADEPVGNKRSTEEMKKGANPRPAENGVAINEKEPAKVGLVKKVAVSKRYAAKKKDLPAPKEVKENKVPPTFAGKRKDIMPAETMESQRSIEGPVVSRNDIGDDLPALTATGKNATSPKQSIGSNVTLTSHAVYKEIGSAEDDEDKVFYLGSAEINKNKLKGLFKKAVGFLQKKNEKDEDGKSVRIASFEIKSK